MKTVLSYVFLVSAVVAEPDTYSTGVMDTMCGPTSEALKNGTQDVTTYGNIVADACVVKLAGIVDSGEGCNFIQVSDYSSDAYGISTMCRCFTTCIQQPSNFGYYKDSLYTKQAPTTAPVIVSEPDKYSTGVMDTMCGPTSEGLKNGTQDVTTYGNIVADACMVKLAGIVDSGEGCNFIQVSDYSSDAYGISTVCRCFTTCIQQPSHFKDSLYTKQAPTTAPATVSGDPHVTTVHGKHFLLNSIGRVNLLTLASFSLFADLESIRDVKCSPSYIRKVTINSGHSSFSARRGAVTFSETHDETFQVASNGGEWKDMSDSMRFAEGDLAVIATGHTLECNDDAQQDQCLGFVVSVPEATLRVTASHSAHGMKHYFNVNVLSVNSTNKTPSGILWGDVPVSAPCNL